MPKSELAILLDQCVRGELSRRQFFLRGMALGCTLASLAILIDAARDSAAAANELSARVGWFLSGWARAKWVTNPFEKASNANISFQKQGFASQSLAKIQAEKAKPTVDVWLTATAIPLLLAKVGLLEELDVSKVPNIANIVPNAVGSCQGQSVAGIHLNANLIIVDNQRD